MIGPSRLGREVTCMKQSYKCCVHRRMKSCSEREICIFGDLRYNSMLSWTEQAPTPPATLRYPQRPGYHCSVDSHPTRTESSASVDARDSIMQIHTLLWCLVPASHLAQEILLVPRGPGPETTYNIVTIVLPFGSFLATRTEVTRLQALDDPRNKPSLLLR